MMLLVEPIRHSLHGGVVIPASPLALNSARQLDERRQRGVWRYYSDAGVGGIAVGVHTTQFAIRDPKIGLFDPLLQLAREEFDRIDAKRESPLIRVAGVCGRTEQAVAEAAAAAEHGFHLGLLSLGAMGHARISELVEHCREVGNVLPLFGFYLQPAAGGIVLPYRFWREFLELESLAAIKVAAFNRYQTIDVVRAVVESARDDVALYTGNDDNIVMDLLTPYRFMVNRAGDTRERRFVGGLLGHWACWTRRAVELLQQCHSTVRRGERVGNELLQRNVEVTDANAAVFDVANGFAGCIPGVHEALRRQGLLDGCWCLDPHETLSPGQAAEIDRVCEMYPHLTDDQFVAEHLDQWLSD
ncbi:MAG: dihydrodipicolinate synthase family protein [Pirellulaceae bacterium]